MILGLWQLAAHLGWINPVVSSSPSGVWSSAREIISNGVLGPAVLSTARLFAIGFGLSLVLGLFLGVIIGWYRAAGALLDPWVSILYAAPRIAFIPLITVWFGIGLKSQVVLVVLVAVFPIVINVSAGVSSIERSHFQLARSYLATNKDVLLTVALPGAVPHVVAGIRQGMMQGLIGVVVAEYFIGNTGVGGLIFNAGSTLQTGQAFVGAIVFAIAALVLTAALTTVERRLDRWRA